MDNVRRGVGTEKRPGMGEVLICFGLTLFCNWLAYFGTRLFTTERYHYDLTCGLDSYIPFLPWTIVIYWGCYLYWGCNYWLGARQGEREVYRFFGADFLAKCICLVCFLIFPTTNVRPDIQGSGLFEGLMRLLYRVDAADNLFPSIHCLTSWFCYIAVRRQEGIPAGYRRVSLACTLAICLSTLTTRQHVLWDVAGGIALAEGSFWLVAGAGFDKCYEGWVKKLGKIIDRKDEGGGSSGTADRGCTGVEAPPGGKV